MKISPRKSHFNNVDHIEILDKYRVRIHMKEPDATLLGTLAFYEPCLGIVPRGAGEPKGEITHPVGTGPFKFVEWKPDRHLILERFDQYVPQPGPMNGLGGQRVAYLDKIKFVPIPEESVAIMALLNKEVDFLWFVPHNKVETFRKEYAKRGIVPENTLGGAFYFMFFNCKEGITKNLNFRKACAHAIDTKMIMDAAIYGNGKSASSFVPQINPLFTPFHNTWYKKDVQKAKDLLKNSGYQGEVIEIVACKQYEPMYKDVIAVQSELAAIGIKTKLTLLDWPTLISRMYKNEFQICSYGLSYRPDPNQAYFYLKFHGFEDQFPRMKAIKEEAGKTMDIETRRKLYEEAHQLVYEGVPVIGFFNYNLSQAHWNYVKGYKIWSANLIRFWGVWLDK